jgi:hypothetical protein
VDLFGQHSIYSERRREPRYLHGEKALQTLAMEVALQANHQADSPLCHLAGVKVAGILEPVMLFLFFLQENMHDTLRFMQICRGVDG